MSMVSPVKGYLTSAYGYRGGTLHAGVDIATGGVAAPVYAAFAGVVSNIVRGRKRYQPASVGPVVAPYRTGDGMRVHNPDGEQQLYIHMRPLASLQNGDRVAAGELIGYVNLSGNTSGYHLHFEVWSRSGHTRNPVVDFRAFGLGVGSTPKKLSAPKPKPTQPPGNLTASVKTALKRMGLDPTIEGIKDYQKAHGLVADGHWGKVTERYYKWVRAFQTYLNKISTVKKAFGGGIVVDGYHGKQTRDARRIGEKARGYNPPDEPSKRA